MSTKARIQPEESPCTYPLTNYFTVSLFSLGEFSALVRRYRGQKVHGLVWGHHVWRWGTGTVTATAVSHRGESVLVAIVLAFGRGKDVVQPLGRVDCAVGALSMERISKLDRTCFSTFPRV